MFTDRSTNSSLELLAPAGDWDSLLAGIAAGADAVYLGSKTFNARQNAANFDLEQLREATDLLHLHQLKIYVTVNTLIAESELEEALDHLNQLYNFGVDAVIIQDLGLIKLARRYLPDLELHASTQMTVHNWEGASLLKDLGLKRIVLARELTKKEIEAIVTKAGVEVEIFIHGALCICYSGQCLMSSMIGGRSGNRGRCAQPCRMEYQLGRNETELIPTKGSYLLSPKDLALLTEIPELHRVGVRSLKIEGRMKRPEYVYNVVKVYRRVLDRYRENPAEFKVDPAEIKELEQSFNRGFTTGYFGGDRNFDIMSFTRPNNRGVYLGRIAAMDRATQQVSLKLDADLETGDEVEVWVSQGGRSAGPIREMFRDGNVVHSAKAGEKVLFKIEGKVALGDRVFKVFSIKKDLETKQALDKENPNLKIACAVEVSGELGTSLRIIYRDDQGNQGMALTDICLQLAKNRPLSHDNLMEQLGRLGNTPYYLNDLQVSMGEGLMLPVSELNQARRRAIDELTAMKLKPYRKEPLKLGQLNLFSAPKTKISAISGNHPNKVQLSAWVADLAGVAAAIEAGADLIYIGGDELTGFHWSEDLLAAGVVKAHNAGVRLVIGLPRINREGQRDQWYPYLIAALKSKADGLMVSDLGTLQFMLAESDQPLYLNYTFNFFNSYSFSGLENQRIKQITLSPELTLVQIKEIRSHQPKTRLECLIQGPIELMVSEYCPINAVFSEACECKNLCRTGQYFFRDRLNLDFPVNMDQYCRMHLMNAKDLCLYGDLEKLLVIPELAVRLELKTLAADTIKYITHRYREALEKSTGHQGTGDHETVIAEIKSLTGRGITKGHYFRGVE